MTKTLVLCMAFLYMVLPGVSLAGSHKNNGHGTVTDRESHLMWQQGEGGKMNWHSAIAYCKNLSLAGHNDWRLPNKEELESIIAFGEIPAINKTNFPKADVSSAYWSSTTSVGVTPRAWVVGFYSGYSYSSFKTNSAYVRCVRVGQ